MSTASLIQAFFPAAEQKFAVVGASSNRAKFGNKVLRWYIDNGYTAVPVNPKEDAIESVACVRSLSALPGSPSEYHVSIVTPPSVTQSVLEEAHKNGIKRVWLQPNVEFTRGSRLCPKGWPSGLGRRALCACRRNQ
ncbi:unnamed protein product [Mortierella alpina]